MKAVATAIRELARAVLDLPLPFRFALIGAGCCGVLGGIAGLVVGLIGYPPTAWAAVIEAGAPAAILGAVTGFILGTGTWVARRLIHQ